MQRFTTKALSWLAAYKLKTWAQTWNFQYWWNMSFHLTEWIVNRILEDCHCLLFRIPLFCGNGIHKYYSFLPSNQDVLCVILNNPPYHDTLSFLYKCGQWKEIENCTLHCTMHMYFLTWPKFIVTNVFNWKFCKTNRVINWHW